MAKLPRSSEGSIHVSPETDILNSNPHMGAVIATQRAAKEARKELPNSSATATQVASQQLTGDDKFWAVNGPCTMDDVLRLRRYQPRCF